MSMSARALPSACKHVPACGLHLSARFRPIGPSLVSFCCSDLRPGAHDEPLPAAVGFCALGEATGRLAEVLRAAERSEAAC
jgi:hypothetical protein